MHIDTNGLIGNYGYLALLFGCILEGETFTLLAGIAAHEGLLSYGGGVAAAMAGGALGVLLLFWLGRRYGTRILRRFKKHQDKLVKARHLNQRHPSLFVIGVRFMYGFRLIGPIIIGASRLRPLKFFLLNLLGAAIWAFLFVTLGYFAGEMIGPLLHKIDQHIKHLLWLVAAVVFAFLLRVVIQRWNNKRAG